MKPQLLKRNRKDYIESISYRHTVEDHFLDLWHYHEELELVYVVQSSGNFFVGDGIERFEAGTLVLLGENLPHGWFNEQKYFKEPGTYKAESIAIHFSYDFLKTNLKNIPEFLPIAQLMERSKVGIQFIGAERRVVMEALVDMQEQDEFQRLLSFLQILRWLSEDEHYKTLSSAGYVKMFRETNDRLGRVHEFIMNNFHRDISLAEVSKIALMNKSAFCRYFKKATKKSFSQYLNEIRIGFACRILQEKESTAISEVAFEAGYNNLSNFNRQFKLIMDCTPTEYLKRHSNSRV